MYSDTVYHSYVSLYFYFYSSETEYYLTAYLKRTQRSLPKTKKTDVRSGA